MIPLSCPHGKSLKIEPTIYIPELVPIGLADELDMHFLLAFWSLIDLFLRERERRDENIGIGRSSSTMYGLCPAFQDFPAQQ
jgi:hypothetical protein